MTLTRLLLSLLMSAALAGCATHASLAPLQYVDERTGSSIFVTAAPLEFARSRNDVAAHARDYATVVAVVTDDAGTYNEYLLLYRWSTVDERFSSAPAAAAGALRVEADGRVIDLPPIEPLPQKLLPRSELLQPQHAHAIVHAYRTDWATLRYLAGCRALALRMPQERMDTPFSLWRDGRGALTELVQVHPGQ
jgi:hypothetical protein